MPVARRVQLAPPGPWDEGALLSAARGLPAAEVPVRPGDDVGGLVVVGVDPAPGASIADDTEFEILVRPRPAEGAQVDLIVLVDVSESMATPWSAKHTRLEAARESIAAMLRSPGRGVATVGIFEYAKDARLVAGPGAPASLMLPVGTTPKGPSETATGLNEGLAHLAAHAREGYAQAIVLLTDGVGDVAELLVAADRAGRLRVPIHSIVFAPEIDEVFDDLARASGGTAQCAAMPLVIEFEHQPGGTDT